MSTPLDAVIAHGRLLLVAGPGGVGKTTTSAALALAAARQGRRTLVMTIDPARRLADSLGLDGLDLDPRAVASAGGPLWAMMLDVESGLERFVREELGEADAAERLLSHRLYQVLADALHGMQEYVAVQQLYTLHQSGDYDLIVVDTPPSTHALDFLDAPTRLERFFDRRFIRWLLPAASRAPTRFLRPGAALTKMLGMLLGGPFVDELISFFSAAEPVLAPLQQRGQAVTALLRDPDTAFALVTRPELRRVDEVLAFEQALSAHKQKARAFIVNRTTLGLENHAPIEALRPTLADLPAADQARMLADISTYEAQLEARVAADRGACEALARVAGRDRLRVVPHLGADVHDLEGLTRIAEHLLSVA